VTFLSLNSDRPAAAALARAALIAMASLLATNASHAARCVACRGVRSPPGARRARGRVARQPDRRLFDQELPALVGGAEGLPFK
jgi:hypothetical protein